MLMLGNFPTVTDPSSGPGEGEVLFEELRYDVLEGAGSVTLVAILSGAISSSENVSVSVTTIDGSATVAGMIIRDDLDVAVHVYRS